MVKFCFQIYIQNKIYNNINNALLHGPEHGFSNYLLGSTSCHIPYLVLYLQ